MKSTRSIIAVLFALQTAQIASAYYCPSTGRWLSRDPVGELGFQKIQSTLLTSGIGNSFSQSSGRWLNRDSIADLGFKNERNIGLPSRDVKRGFIDGPNNYDFLLNNPISNVDCFGLLKFIGCSPSQQDAYQKAFNEGCQKAKSAAFKCCLNHFNIPQRLNYMCDNNSDITIKCEPDSGYCKGNCGYSFPGGSTIHVCPQSLDNQAGCGEPRCTLLHELTHMIGHPFEKWPQKVEKCLDCQEYD